MIVVISFAEPERLAPYQEHHHWPFVMLADPKRIAYQAFALKPLILVPGFFAVDTEALLQAVARRQEIPELWQR